MTIDTYTPIGPLQPFIKKYLVIESRQEVINRVLPDTSVVLAFRYKGQVNYIEGIATDSVPSAAISGLRKSVRLINYKPYTATLLVLFTEAGCGVFLKSPLHELFEQSVSLDSFIPAGTLSLIEEQLGESQNNIQRVGVIEDFLLSRLHPYNEDKLITIAIQILRQWGGIINIRELAAKLYISQDALEKRFRKATGTSPKQFANIIRMRELVTQKEPLQNFTSLALAAGYYDQPHFNKDFKLFTGQTPTEFFKSPSLW